MKITTLCKIRIGINAVADTAAKIPKGANGSRWVSLPAGAMVRVGDVRAMERTFKKLQKKPRRQNRSALRRRKLAQEA